MSTAGKVFTAFLITTAILVPVVAVTAATTMHCTDTNNPVNLCLYCRFKIIENSITDKDKNKNFYAVKKFVDSGNSKYCLTVTSTYVYVTNIETFNFYDSWEDVPQEIKKDTSLATNWDAVERYVTAKEKEIKNRKEKEKAKELKKKQPKNS